MYIYDSCQNAVMDDIYEMDDTKLAKVASKFEMPTTKKSQH